MPTSEAATAAIVRPVVSGGADGCRGVPAQPQRASAAASTAAEQQRAAHPVALGQLAPGDLVFFGIRGHGVDHVGIYAGDGRFIHAPRAGLAVTYGDLGRGFYGQHVASAGRFWDGAAPAR